MSLVALVDKLSQDPRNSIIKVAWAGGGWLVINWDVIAPLGDFAPLLSGLPVTTIFEHGLPPGVINLKSSNINQPSDSSVPISQVVTDEMASAYIMWTNAPPSSAQTLVGHFGGGGPTYDVWRNVVPGPPPQAPAFEYGGLFFGTLGSFEEAARIAAEMNKAVIDSKAGDQYLVTAVEIAHPRIDVFSTETRASYIFNLGKLGALLPVNPATGQKPTTLTFVIDIPGVDGVDARDNPDFNSYAVAKTFGFNFRTYKKKYRNFVTGQGQRLLDRGEIGSTPLWYPPEGPTDNDVVSASGRSSRREFADGKQIRILPTKFTVTINLKTLEITEILEG